MIRRSAVARAALAGSTRTASPCTSPAMRYCDLSCPHATFPKDSALDGSGSCRTFIALHCDRLGSLVAKNARCEWEKEKKVKPEDHPGEC